MNDKLLLTHADLIYFQKRKLAENMSSSTHFWKELKKISTANKVTTNVMDNAPGDKNVMELLLTK